MEISTGTRCLLPARNGCGLRLIPDIPRVVMVPVLAHLFIGAGLGNSRFTGAHIVPVVTRAEKCQPKRKFVTMSDKNRTMSAAGICVALAVGLFLFYSPAAEAIFWGKGCRADCSRGSCSYSGAGGVPGHRSPKDVRASGVEDADCR